MPQTPTDIREQLIRDEGYRKFPYVDTKAKITIGIGYNLSDNGISDAVIDAMYRERMTIAQNAVQTRLPWFQNLDQIRQAVILNMCFNMGFTKLEEFQKFLMAMAQSDWQAAVPEMENSVWAEEVGDRAKRLAEQLITGKWV